MTRNIYVASAEGRTGKSVIALGLIELLTQEVKSVGVFRPVVKSSKSDRVLEALLSQKGIDQTFEESIGATYRQVRDDPDEALSQIIGKYGQLESRFDAIVIAGSDYTDVSTSTELTFNARVAANLNAPVVLVVSGQDRNPAQIMKAGKAALDALEHEHNNVIGMFATRTDPERLVETKELLHQLAPNLVVAALPQNAVLAAPTVRDQFKALDAKLVTGSEDFLDRESLGVLIAGMTLPNVLPRLFPEATVLTAGDRTDLLPGLMLANDSGTFPALASIILLGGYEIPESFGKLLAGLDQELPIGITKLGTFQSAEKLFQLEGVMTASPRKVEIARRIFAENVNTKALLNALDVAPTDIRTPLMFEYQLMKAARSDRRRIVLPEASDDRILESTAILLRRGVADIILLGEQAALQARASVLGLDIDGARIISPKDPELLEKFAEEYARLRAHKGVSVIQARDKLTDLSYFGTMMVHFGMADGMVSGAVNTTANTIRPSLEFIKTKPGVKIVSSSFLMCMADQVHVYADCAVNPDPSAEQLADIAISSAETAVNFGIEPRVAMLSYSTGSSGSGTDVDKVRRATEIVKERAPQLAVEGPIQFDAAVDPAVAATKLPNSQVAGRATVFIFPDLNTGNNTYKAVQRSSGAVAIGPVLQGLNKPVNDLSRGALVDDIVNTVAITAIQAQDEKEPQK